MQIKEGTFTAIHYLFVPEIIVKQDIVDSDLIEENRKILSETYPGQYHNMVLDVEPGNVRHNGYEIRDIGTFDKCWQHWWHLSHKEYSSSKYSYAPRFLIPNAHLELQSVFPHHPKDFELKIPPELLSEFNIENYSISPRVLYYPFGLFAIRFRTYFKASEGMTPNEHIDFRYQSINKIVTAETKPPQNIGFYRQKILDSVFNKDIPSRYKRNNEDRYGFYPITYSYSQSDAALGEIAKIVANDKNDLRQEFAEKKTTPNLGRYKGDQIFLKKSGAFLHTPIFQENTTTKRRRRRLKLRNSVYSAVDFGMFENNSLPELQSILKDVLRQLNDGTLTSAPLGSSEIILLADILQFPENFIGNRQRYYAELRPERKKKQYAQELDNRINQILQHDSELEKLVSMDSVKTILSSIIGSL